MKKIIALLAAALVSAATLVCAQTAGDPTAQGADIYADRTTRTINVEDKYADLHPTASNVKITLEYTPLTGEVRLYYECLAANFEVGEAMNTAMGVYQDFAQEHGYKHYYYRAKDKTKYFRDNSSGANLRMARYNSYVYFTK